jgi:hypothetical protein
MPGRTVGSSWQLDGYKAQIFPTDNARILWAKHRWPLHSLLVGDGDSAALQGLHGLTSHKSCSQTIVIVALLTVFEGSPDDGTVGRVGIKHHQQSKHYPVCICMDSVQHTAASDQVILVRSACRDS